MKIDGVVVGGVEKRGNHMKMSGRATRLGTRLAFAILLAHAAWAQSGNSNNPKIPPASVWTAVQPYLIAAGDRYYKPGHERVVATGTIVRGAAAAVPVQVTWEFPGKVQIEESGSITTYNSASPNQPNRSSAQMDTLETLVEDTIDGFLTAHAGNAGTHVIGRGFQVDGHPGQFLDIIRLTAKSGVRPSATTTIKEYQMDSRSRLLAVTAYHTATNVAVAVSFSNWQNTQGQLLSKTIVRSENGVAVFTLNFITVAYSAAANDGKFGN
jgi:hypothetical protein